MKKMLTIVILLAFCSILVFSGCSAADKDLVLAVSGKITDIQSSDGNATIMVDGSGFETDASYQSMFVHLTDKIPVTIDDKTENYSDNLLNVGDVVEVYLDPNTPVAASEPPQATPAKIVVISRAEDTGTQNEDIQKVFDGKITEILDDGDYYLVYVQKEENGDPINDLRAVVSSETIITTEDNSESKLKPEDLKEGQNVTVTTDGRMTFSIPPQANAQTIVIKDA